MWMLRAELWNNLCMQGLLIHNLAMPSIDTLCNWMQPWSFCLPTIHFHVPKWVCVLFCFVFLFFCFVFLFCILFVFCFSFFFVFFTVFYRPKTTFVEIQTHNKKNKAPTANYCAQTLTHVDVLHLLHWIQHS